MITILIQSRHFNIKTSKTAIFNILNIKTIKMITILIKSRHFNELNRGCVSYLHVDVIAVEWLDRICQRGSAHMIMDTCWTFVKILLI